MLGTFHFSTKGLEKLYAYITVVLISVHAHLQEVSTYLNEALHSQKSAPC